MAFIDELLPLMPHILTATPVTLDAYGTPTPSGPSIPIPCQIEGVNRMVRDNQGREVVSSFFAYCGEFNDLSVDGYVFSLPAEYGPPNDSIKAIRIDPASDETGQIYEIVVLP